jgi:hypothetical protein
MGQIVVVGEDSNTNNNNQTIAGMKEEVHLCLNGNTNYRKDSKIPK